MKTETKNNSEHFRDALVTAINCKVVTNDE